MGDLKVRVHVFVGGRVQGVFFRVEAQREAFEKRVTGWVRNTSDGRVEAVFEGEKLNVEKMIEFCRRGPSVAKVKKLDVYWEDYVGEFNRFEIRKTVLV